MLTLSMLLSTASGATFSEVPSLKTLTTRSAAIVRGEVLVSMTEPCSLGLCTTHTVLVHEHLKGETADTVEVVVPGGRYRGLTQRASGVPIWEEGTDVLLFVSPDGTIPLTGMFSFEDDRTLDPLARPIPSTVAALRDTLARTLAEAPVVP